MTNNKAITKDNIRNLIVDLNLPNTILELFDEVCTDSILNKNGLLSEYSYPYKIFVLNKNQQDNYLVDQYKPFLSKADNTILAYDIVSKGYIEYSIELMDREPQILTWDGLFITEILCWWEYEIEDDDILYIGKLFGLQHTQEILADIYITSKNKGFSTTQKVDKWKNTILNRINGYITTKQ